jgi:hypothetical protein
MLSVRRDPRDEHPKPEVIERSTNVPALWRRPFADSPGQAIDEKQILLAPVRSDEAWERDTRPATLTARRYRPGSQGA